MAAFQKVKVYDDKVQIWAMHSKYPQFKFKRTKEGYIEFSGVLRVKPELPEYSVSIIYRKNIDPLIYVSSPKLVIDAPHIYPSTNSLCLYHPDLFKWNKTKVIANEIMTWTAGWIYFYEAWLQTGLWLGPEAAHEI